MMMGEHGNEVDDKFGESGVLERCQMKRPEAGVWWTDAHVRDLFGEARPSGNKRNQLNFHHSLPSLSRKLKIEN
jgi:hypothetical protein